MGRKNGNTTSDLSNLYMELDKLGKDFRIKRRDLCEKSGKKLFDQVHSEISITVKEKTGNLKDSVFYKVGSGGGYVAVDSDRKVAPHTHLIEFGHAVVVDGITRGFAPGKYVFSNAAEKLKSELKRDSEKFIDDLVREFEK